MKRIFKVKNADKTVNSVFINGLWQTRGKGFTLTKDSIKVKPG